MTGMELHARLAAERPRDAERLVFITGGAFTADARSYVERTGTPCVEKPFVAEELRARVRAAVQEPGGRGA